MSEPPYLEPPLRSRTIAIIGYAETSWPPESVWADPNIEKWTLNHGHNIDPQGRWDRLFEFHSRDVIDEETRLHHRGVDQWAVLQGERKRPIYMRARHDDVLCSVRFPIEKFVKFYGMRCDKLKRRPYVEMAAGYMLGYAVMALFPEAMTSSPEIQVYGFELFDGDEYAHQRANFEFYAAWAMGAGIRVDVPDSSAIFSSRGLYEYDNGEASALLNKADTYLDERFKEMTRKFHDVKAQNDECVAQMQTISGIMQEVEMQRKMIRHLLRGGSY